MTIREYRTDRADISRAEIDALGLAGWELCGFGCGVAWFKRDRDARILKEQAERHAVERGAR